MTETEALIALNQLPVAGPVKIRRLLENFGNAVNTLKESNSSLQRIQGIGQKPLNSSPNGKITLILPQSCNSPKNGILKY